MNKKTLLIRKYHDGDIVRFTFEPNSLDVHCQEVPILGVISGVLYEKYGIRYKVLLRDNKRDIFGDMVIPEGAINEKIESI